MLLAILGVLLGARWRRRRRSSNAVDWESIRASAYRSSSPTLPSPSMPSPQMTQSISEATSVPYIPRQMTVSPRLMVQTPPLSMSYMIGDEDNTVDEDPFADPQSVARSRTRFSASPTIRASEPVAAEQPMASVLEGAPETHIEDAFLHAPAPLLPDAANVNRLSVASSGSAPHSPRAGSVSDHSCNILFSQS